MVGGKVVGTTRKGDGTTRLTVADGLDECAVRVGGSRHIEVRPGDSVWWQGEWVLWTPDPGKARGRCGIDFDIRLLKIK